MTHSALGDSSERAAFTQNSFRLFKTFLSKRILFSLKAGDAMNAKIAVHERTQLGWTRIDNARRFFQTDNMFPANRWPATRNRCPVFPAGMLQPNVREFVRVLAVCPLVSATPRGRCALESRLCSALCD